MQTHRRPELKVEQALYEEAADLLHETTRRPVIVPTDGCQCLACEVARIHLLPFLPVTWH